MQRDRAMTIHFMDGTKVSFDFPAQRANEAARAIMIEEMLKSPYLMVETAGVLLVYPVANIKSVQIMVAAGHAKVATPKTAIRGAVVVE